MTFVPSKIKYILDVNPSDKTVSLTTEGRVMFDEKTLDELVGFLNDARAMIQSSNTANPGWGYTKTIYCSPGVDI